jgi:predicted Zn-dependent protease
MESHPTTPVFLSTHPSDKDRITKVNEKWNSLGGKQGEYYKDRYTQFKNSLP